MYRKARPGYTNCTSSLHTVYPGLTARGERGPEMISLNYRDARPIYEQVKDGLRHLVVTGALQSGDKLPSVRALASALAINPNTIQRAYESLESEGYLYTVAGKGSFAAPQTGINLARRQALLGQFDQTAAELLFLGLTADELAGRLRRAGIGLVGEEDRT